MTLRRCRSDSLVLTQVRRYQSNTERKNYREGILTGTPLLIRRLRLPLCLCVHACPCGHEEKEADRERNMGVSECVAGTSGGKLWCKSQRLFFTPIVKNTRLAILFAVHLTQSLSDLHIQKYCTMMCVSHCCEHLTESMCASVPRQKQVNKCRSQTLLMKEEDNPSPSWRSCQAMREGSLQRFQKEIVLSL